MKVLIVAKDGNRNTFISNLRGSISKNIEVDCGIDKFWKDEKQYDIIHVQWPEMLSFMVSRRTFSPNNQRIKKVDAQLKKLKSGGAKIVITRHNVFPHNYSSNYEKLYEIVFNNMNGVIHMGDYSHQEFLKRYPDLTNIKHTVIPHGWYDNIPNDCTKEEARKFLNLKEDAFVILAFGALRDNAEEQMLFESFKLIQNPNKLLIIPRGYYNNKNILYRLFDFLNLKFYKKLIQKKAEKLKTKRILWNQSFVDENDIQYYFNASDLLVIPRIDILNSGNVPLGFSFKKVVVGPKVGNIGEILSKTNNPTFDPNNYQSIAKAIETSLILKDNGLGSKNFEYAKQHWNWSDIGKKHVDFYKTV